MATKKISELTNVTSVQDTDLFIVETSEGTRAVAKNNIIPKALSELTEDSTHKLVTDAEKTAWNAKQSTIRISSVTLTASAWGFDSTNNWYWQNLTISGVTANTKIDVQPNADVIRQIMNDGVAAVYIMNIDGTPVAYTLGAALTADVTLQITLTEVE